MDADGSCSQPRGALGEKLAVSAMACGMLAGFSLLFGLYEAGGGHGTYYLWFLGLELSAGTWCLLLACVVVELRAWLKGVRPRWWLPFVGVMLVIGTLVGLWGLEG